MLLHFLNWKLAVSKRIFFGYCLVILLFFATRLHINAQCGCTSGQQFLPPMHWLGIAEVSTTAKKRLSLDFIYKYGNGNKTFEGTKQVSDVVDYEFHLFDLFVNYGISNYLSLDLLLNYNFKKLDEYGFKRKGYGFSNFSAGLRYNLYETGSSDFVISSGFGLRVPLMKLKPIEQSPTAIQPTNGSFGVYGFGFAQYSLLGKRLNLLLYSRLDYNFQNSANYQFGTAIITSVFTSYRFTEAIVSLLELRYSHLTQDKYNDTLYPNSGANMLHFAPRFSYKFGSYSLSPFLEIPLYQYFKGVQIGTRFSFGINFNYIINLSRRKL